jgi:hypothetical protein
MSTTTNTNSPSGCNVYKMCSYLQKLDDESEEKSVLERCALDKLADLQIFKTNPKFYTRLRMVTEGENFYEAQQMYKTVNFRYVRESVC